MEIQIIPRTVGGTEFCAVPHRLHLGAQDAAGVDRLHFILPDEWRALSVSLHIRRSDGTLASPIVLDADDSAAVGRSFTACASGQWMLAATSGTGYTAYTRPGTYDVHGILPTDGTEEEPTPSVYEQFVARVVANAGNAASSAKSAAASEANARAYLTEASAAAQSAKASQGAAVSSAARAESAAARAEAAAPSSGAVVSVNGKGGIVTLAANDVSAVPKPSVPVAGCLVRVLAVDPNTGALTTDAVTPSEVGALTGAEKKLILKLFAAAAYTDTASTESYAALKQLWDSSTEAVVPVQSVALSQSALSLTVGGTATLNAAVLPATATDRTISWSVSGAAATIVGSGTSCTITAAAVGTATVTAAAGGKTASCTVTVKTAAVSDIITIDTVNDNVDRNWLITTPMMSSYFVPLTAKKNVTLKQLSFILNATASSTLDITLTSVSDESLAVVSSASIVNGENTITLDYNAALKAGKEYRLTLEASGEIMCYPLLPDASLRENDYISVNGTSYQYNNDEIRYIGYIKLKEAT